MRTLKRNQREIYYATLIQGEPVPDEDETEEPVPDEWGNETWEPVTDEWGNETGEYNMVYSDPSPIRINVSAAQGRLETRQFGQMENYDRTLITDDMDCPIDESSILWIDNLDTTKPHDYVVTKVARSLNVIQYAVRKVNVGHG